MVGVVVGKWGSGGVGFGSLGRVIRSIIRRERIKSGDS